VIFRFWLVTFIYIAICMFSVFFLASVIAPRHTGIGPGHQIVTENGKLYALARGMDRDIRTPITEEQRVLYNRYKLVQLLLMLSLGVMFVAHTVLVTIGLVRFHRHNARTSPPVLTLSANHRFRRP